MKNHTKWGVAALCLAMVALATSSAPASPVTLKDLNTTVQVDPMSPTGLTSWNVQGMDHLREQSFWIRAGAATAERPLGSLPVTQSTIDSNFNGVDETLIASYTGATYTVDMNISVTGGTAVLPLSSSIGEQITISNTTNSPLAVTFFQYVDLDLVGSSTGDTLFFDPSGNTATQMDGPLAIAEVVSTTGGAAPIAYQGAFVPTILNSLMDGGLTNLNNTPAGGVSIGGGSNNVELAFQWDFNLPANGSGQISKLKTLSIAIPLPVAVWPGLALLGMMAAVRVRRWRASSGTR